MITQSWSKEGIVGGIWSEPRNNQSCRNFFGSHPISFLTLRHPLWKMPLAGSEMSTTHLMDYHYKHQYTWLSREREPSACLQACTPPHIRIQAHPYPSLWLTHHDCQCVLGRPRAQGPKNFPTVTRTPTGVQLEDWRFLGLGVYGVDEALALVLVCGLDSEEELHARHCV